MLKFCKLEKLFEDRELKATFLQKGIAIGEHVRRISINNRKICICLMVCSGQIVACYSKNAKINQL